MEGDLGKVCMDLVNSNSNKNFISKTYVEKLYNENKLGEDDHSEKLWAVLIFYLWIQKHYYWIQKKRKLAKANNSSYILRYWKSKYIDQSNLNFES